MNFLYSTIQFFYLFYFSFLRASGGFCVALYERVTTCTFLYLILFIYKCAMMSNFYFIILSKNCTKLFSTWYLLRAYGVASPPVRHSAHTPAKPYFMRLEQSRLFDPPLSSPRLSGFSGFRPEGYSNDGRSWHCQLKMQSQLAGADRFFVFPLASDRPPKLIYVSC